MKITKKTMTIGAGATALIAAGAALAQPGGMRADANDDGNVTRAELNAFLDERFARADANSDGAIDASEREAMRSERRRHRGERRGRHGGEGRRGGRHGHGARMERLDSNGDGRITREELGNRAIERFNSADANGDGTVTREERRAARAAFRAERRGQ